MNDKQLARMNFRIELFKRRGLDEQYASELADRCAQRDFEREDMHYCLECSNLQRGGACAMAKVSPDMRGNFLQPVPDIMCRCPSFKWQTPA